MSSVCDGWQPGEARYLLTRRCLEILLHYHYPLTVLTKNVLAGRDLDLLASAKDGVEFGVTITTLDEGIRRVIEPVSSPSAERLNILQEARRRGIRTYAFLGPLLPGLSDTEANINALLGALKEVGVDYFYIDRLNRRFGVWQALKVILQEHYPGLLGMYQKLLFDEGARMEYSERLMSTVNGLARRHGLDGRMQICF